MALGFQVLSVKGSPSLGATGRASWERDQLQGVSADGIQGRAGFKCRCSSRLQPLGRTFQCPWLGWLCWAPSLGAAVCAGIFAVAVLGFVSSSCAAKGR